MKRLGSGIGRAALVACTASLLAIPAAASANHGPTAGHLPPVQQELDVVGELELTEEFGDVVPGQIADVSVFKDHAYLNSWDEPSCTRGGTYIADISDPAAPEEIGFLPAQAGYYHGEGAHVASIDTPQFTGDLLAVNDEACSNSATRPPNVPPTAGGFDLYDVTDPANPVTLIQNFGDTTLDGSLDPDPDPDRLPNSYHSVFVWQDGPKAYLVGVDNVEFGDVDIYDITDPDAPEFIADHDLVLLFPEIVDESALGNNIFQHDMVVKVVGGQLRLLSSYWDAGYVQLDITNPVAPTYITDTNFDAPDPLFGFDPPEGNAHQAEYSHDNEFFLAADEDFSPGRLTEVEITTGPNAGTFDGSVVPGGAPPATLDDEALNGPTVYGGYGCTASAAIPPRASAGLPPLESGEEAIVVLQRGPSGDPEAPEAACFPGEKARNGIEAGYDAVLLVTHHAGELSGTLSCGSGDFQGEVIVAACTTHEAYHLLFGTTPATEIPYVAANEPSIGDLGEYVNAENVFDGWGYAHLYDAETSAELDAFAIPEARDDRFQAGFGDLSIHEFATDPTEDLAYSSYYSGGIRVLSYDREDGLKQRGAWIDEEGSNFWGIEQFTTPQGDRLIAGSDRDFGLVILRYTGHGAPEAPSCSSAGAATEEGTAVSVPLTCTDANGNTLTLRIVDQPANGTLGPVLSDSVLYTPDPGFVGSDEFTFVANDGAADSAEAVAPVAVADTDPPQTEITKAPNKTTGNRAAKFRFRSDEPGSTFKCKLDDDAFTACDSPFSKRVGLGNHRFRVRAIDLAGNPDPTPARWKWTVE